MLHAGEDQHDHTPNGCFWKLELIIVHTFQNYRERYTCESIIWWNRRTRCRYYVQIGRSIHIKNAEMLLIPKKLSSGNRPLPDVAALTKGLFYLNQNWATGYSCIVPWRMKKLDSWNWFASIFDLKCNLPGTYDHQPDLPQLAVTSL